MNYIRKYAVPGTRQPVHDVCLFDLCNQGTWDKKYWAQLVMDHGHEATRYLALAAQIESFKQSTSSNVALSQQGNELDKIRDLLQNFKYKRASENAELAALCLRFIVSEEQFEHCLNIIENKQKMFDVFPNLIIQGADIEPKLKDFRFVKLPINDLRGLFLGDYSSCCQSVRKQGEPSAIHGMTSLHGGFYVVFDANAEIVAQTWALVGTEGEFIFDSWEFSHNSKAFLFKPFITKAAELIIQHGFSRVLIGMGGHTPKSTFTVVDDKKAAKPLDPCSYTDAHKQYLIKSASCADMPTKFFAYTQQIVLSYEKYAHLFEYPDPESLQRHLFVLINNMQVSYNDYCAIIRFAYVSGMDFMHHKSDAGLKLLFVLLREYGLKMENFIYLKNRSNISLLETMLSYDNVELLRGVLDLLKYGRHSILLSAGQEKMDRLPHIAIKNNTPKSFNYIYSSHYRQLPWIEYASLQDASGASIFYLAAKNKNLSYIKDYVVAATNKEALFNSLNLVPAYEERTILHYLAEANALQLLKEIYSRLDSIDFCRLLDKSARIEFNGRPMQGGPLFSALFNGSFEFAAWLLKKFYASNLLNIVRTEVCYAPLLGAAANSDNLELIKFLHKCHENEEQWCDSLARRGGAENVLHYAIGSSARCALYIINSISNFDRLHKLLTTNSGSMHAYPLDKLEYTSSLQEVRKISRRILEIYAQHIEKIKDIFDCKDRYVIKSIIKQQDVALFAELLAFLRQDEALFIQLLTPNANEETILDCVINVFEFRPSHDDTPQVPPAITRQFINCLFLNCNQDEVKLLLSNTGYCRRASAATLRYLLSIIDRLDNCKFRHQWFTLDINGPLENSFYNVTDSDSASLVTLEYAVGLYGEERIKNSLLKDVTMMLHAIVTFNNLTLLKYLYPHICSDQAQLADLLDRLLQQSWQSKTLQKGLIWLLDQPDITAAMLFDFISVEKRKSLISCCNSNLDNIKIVPLLWNACTKRMQIKQQIQVIYAIYFDVLSRWLQCDSKDENDKIGQHLKAVKLLLHSWMALLKNHGQLFSTLTAKTPESKTIFQYVCESNNKEMVKIMLHHCDKAQRQQLVDSLRIDASTKEQSLQQKEIAELGKLCDRLEVLLDLKAEINAQPRASTSSFFTSLPPDIDMLRSCLKDIDNESSIFLACEKITELWGKVRLILQGFEIQLEPLPLLMCKP